MEEEDEWYLSFDVATKSFAFALVRVRAPGAGTAARVEALAAAVRAGDAAGALAHAKALDAETRAAFHLAAGGAADLVPGVKDFDIPTVARVRAAVAFLETTVAAGLAAAAADGCPGRGSPRLNVAVEFQMGANAPARTVAAVLVAHFHAARVFFVGPAFKNKLWYAARPDLRHCHFVERYKSLYVANKNHTKELYFDHVGPAFGHDEGAVVRAIPARLRKDFADSIMQVLGFRAFGDAKKAAEMF